MDRLHADPPRNLRAEAFRFGNAGYVMRHAAHWFGGGTVEPDERKRLRATLIDGQTVVELVDGLSGQLYRDLVLEHARRHGKRLPQARSIHERLIEEGQEGEAAIEIMEELGRKSRHPSFWHSDAGRVLNSISCDLNDGMFPQPAPEAGVFNLFQLVTLVFAERTLEDQRFRTLLERGPSDPAPARAESGTITKMLEVAVADFEAGRIAKTYLLRIFQDSIDRGDILLEQNLPVVVGHIAPLVDQGKLEPNEHWDAFEAQMNAEVRAHLQRRSAPQSREGRWWEFWKR